MGAPYKGEAMTVPEKDSFLDKVLQVVATVWVALLSIFGIQHEEKRYLGGPHE